MLRLVVDRLVDAAVSREAGRPTEGRRNRLGGSERREATGCRHPPRREREGERSSEVHVPHVVFEPAVREPRAARLRTRLTAATAVFDKRSIVLSVGSATTQHENTLLLGTSTCSRRTTTSSHRRHRVMSMERVHLSGTGSAAPKHPKHGSGR